MAQQANLEAYAEKQGFEVIGITSERASGMAFPRRGLTEVSGAVAAGAVDLLLVASLSCLGRDLAGVDAYLRWLEDQFVEVVCADGTMPQTSTEMLTVLMKENGISLDRVH